MALLAADTQFADSSAVAAYSAEPTPPKQLRRLEAAAKAGSAKADSTKSSLGSLPAIQLQQVTSGLNSPVTVANAGDGTGRLFIVQQTGQIRIFTDGTLLPIPFLDISDLVSCCGEQGLLGPRFSP